MLNAVVQEGIFICQLCISVIIQIQKNLAWRQRVLESFPGAYTAVFRIMILLKKSLVKKKYNLKNLSYSLRIN